MYYTMYLYILENYRSRNYLNYLQFKVSQRRVIDTIKATKLCNYRVKNSLLEVHMNVENVNVEKYFEI